LPSRTVSLPEPCLEADEGDRTDRRPQDRAAVAVVEERDDRQPERLEADQGGDASMEPLDPDMAIGVEARQELAREATRPMRACLA